MSSRKVARVAAHVPYGYEHDKYQMPGFKSALAYELYFAKKIKSHRISQNYVSLLNAMLQNIHNRCLDFKIAKCVLGYQENYFSTDVIEIELEIGPDYLRLQVIGIRPCFVGHKMFQIVMLQLMQTACLLKKELIVDTCYPRTLDILEHFFGNDIMKVVFGKHMFPNCIFSNFEAMKAVTPESLGVAGYVRDTCPIELLETAFPTPEQLNDSRYVDAFYGARSASRQ